MKRSHQRITPYEKQSFYLDGQMLDELRAEAKAAERSLSYVVQRYVARGLKRLRELPSVEEVA